MLILRRNLGWVDQEEIAKDLGVRIGRHQVDSFHIKLKIAKGKDEADRGIILKEFKQKKVQDFFKKHKIPLKVSVFYKSEIEDVKFFLGTNLKEGNDVMANIYNRTFHLEKDWGHLVLVSEVGGDEVTLCDPGPKNKSFWQTSLKKLIGSMDKRYDGLERGFVVFSKV